MLHGQCLVVVMPAYNAGSTLEQTYSEIPHEYVDDVVLVDDGSSDDTVEVARRLGAHTLVLAENIGYGGNQKNCYRTALALGAEVVVMVHPDYQYSPRLITAMATLITSGHYDIVLGSRILGGNPMKSGMPVYKYIANRLLTFIQNLVLGAKLSEYHTGYRAFSREVLESLPLERNSNDFVFDNQMLVQGIFFKFRIGEISCPTRYFDEASSISLRRSIRYGFGVLATTLQYFLARYLRLPVSIFNRDGNRLETGTAE